MERRRFITLGLASLGAAGGAAIGREIGEPEALTARWVDRDDEEVQLNREAVQRWAQRAETNPQIGGDSILQALVRSDRVVIAVNVRRRAHKDREYVAGTEIREIRPGSLERWPVNWPS